jgi:uncharacterized protein (TIGR00297 family)
VLPLVLASAISLIARRAGSLSTSGAIAATVVGTIAISAGTSWGVFLVIWFVTASALSHLGRSAKATRTGDIVVKGGARDVWQVLANGGVYAAAALVAWAKPDSAPLAAVIGAAALAAAGADTIATEIGTLVRTPPWSLRSFRRVQAGTSGAVSIAGTAAMVLGAIALALLAMHSGLITHDQVPAVGIGAIVGALVDTLIGATVQERRWCPTCQRETEQRVHRCGTSTAPHGGITWLGNDAVNACCTLAGACAAALIC